MKAFPCHPYMKDPDFDGMGLRDYFAGQALQGLLANPKLASHILKEGGAYGGWVEHSAYGWADAMIKARKNES
jgi:hypothetical protein